MTAIRPFDFSGQQVRVVTDEHGDPWFIAVDACAALGISNSRDAVTRLDADGVGTADVIDSMGRDQVARTVNESGLYELVFQSRRPEAREFRRWVTREVLPSIRKTGSYGPSTNPAEITRADMARMILAAEEELAVVSAALKSAEPAIAYHDRYVANDDVVTVKVWGQQFGLTEPQAYELLLVKNVVYRRSLGERWSTKKGCREQVYEYLARAGRQSFAWFDPRPQHNAPRHHNGQVRTTLYVRQPYALDLAKCVGLVDRKALDGAA